MLTSMMNIKIITFFFILKFNSLKKKIFKINSIVDLPLKIPPIFNNIQIKSLYGLRTICVFIVIFSHIRNTPNVPIFISLIGESILFGGLGVQMFFVVSGFLITGNLLKEIVRAKKRILLRFFIKRIFKIFPVFYAYLIVAFLFCYYYELTTNYTSFVNSALYIENFKYSGNWITGHSWSLSVEEQFYFFWPFLIIHSKLRNILIFIFFSLNYEPLIQIISFLFNNKSVLILSPILSYLPPIMFGSLISILYFKDYKIFSRYINKIWIILSIIIILVISTLDRLHLFNFFIQPFGYLINSLLLGYIFISILHLKSNNFWFKVLNNKVFIYIGKISYSVYVWQQLFLIPNGFFKYDFWFTYYPINLVFIFAISSISYAFIEIPCIKLRNKLILNYVD